jgi:alpha-ribazole phosphatase
MLVQRQASKKEFVLVRHGAIEGAGPYVYYGATDYPLSELGRMQAKEAGKRLAKEQFDAIYVSPLSRAKETASILCTEAALDFDSVLYDERLQEMDFGEFEGYSYEQLSFERPDLAKRMESDWLNCVFEGGESPAMFAQRVRDFFESLKKSEHRRVLVIAHGGTVRMGASSLLSLPPEFFWRLKSDHCLISRIEMTDGFGMIRSWNS